MHVLIGYYAGLQSIVEIGLGSFLHAFHIPFSGHTLSLNQGLMLTLSQRRLDSRIEGVKVANGISLIAAAFKSFSPIGKKLTPMLAISIQGFLFSIGVALFGPTLIGSMLGMCLLALWSFAQPVLLAYLFFGEKIFTAISKMWSDLADRINVPVEFGAYVLFGILILKIVLGLIVVFMAWRFHHFVKIKYLDRIQEYKNKTSLSLKVRNQVPPVQGAFKDLFNRWMVLSLLLTICFMYFYESSQWQTIFVYVLRVLSVAWICFWLLRAFPQAWVEKFLNQHPAIKKIVDHVLEEVEQKR